MTKTHMDLAELLAKHDQGDFLRSISDTQLEPKRSVRRALCRAGR